MQMILATDRQNRYTLLATMLIFGTESLTVIRNLKRVLLPCAILASTAAGASFAVAEPQATEPAAESVKIELNKLEPVEKGCRAYLVVNNATPTSYQSFKVDLVLFQADGVIGKRFSLELGPLRTKKKSVKLFDIDAIACDRIGSLLINDVMECKSESGPVEHCLQNLTTSTLTKVELSK
ncbi:MAG: hypothetical protein J0H36_04800 [Hyphomicrobium denitrificans]|nr:hypothetical protein [Hyphomicrobium denitrificans]